MNIPKFTHEFSIIMCSWQNPHLLKKMIPALRRGAKLDTKIFVALNEADKESVEYLLDEKISFFATDENSGTQIVDVLMPLAKSEYSLWCNDDMYLSEGFDQDLVNYIKQYGPAAAQCKGVERRGETDNIVIGDTSLPHWLDDDAYDVFSKNVKDGKYAGRDLLYALFHPICAKTQDVLKVGGFGDNLDMNWYPGHSCDTYFAYKLWKLDNNYKFILSNTSFDYHGSSMTNKKLKGVNPAADARHNSDYFNQKTGMDHRGFHKIVRYGEKIV